MHAIDPNSDSRALTDNLFEILVEFWTFWSCYVNHIVSPESFRLARNRLRHHPNKISETRIEFDKAPLGRRLHLVQRLLLQLLFQRFRPPYLQRLQPQPQRQPHVLEHFTRQQPVIWVDGCHIVAIIVGIQVVGFLIIGEIEIGDEFPILESNFWVDQWIVSYCVNKRSFKSSCIYFWTKCFVLEHDCMFYFKKNISSHIESIWTKCSLSPRSIFAKWNSSIISRIALCNIRDRKKSFQFFF